MQSSIGKTIGKKEMRQMAFMGESENFTAMKRFQRGSGFGQLKSWNNPIIENGLQMRT